MAYYPPYTNIYQPGLYQQMGQPQNQMMMQGQPMPNQQIPVQNQPVPSMQQQLQTVQPPTQQSNSMIWINSKAEADSWPVLAGNAVALWDSNNPVVYLRQADSTGKPSTKIFDLVERTDTKAHQPVLQFDPSKYITIDEAEEMINRCVNNILSERLKRPSNASQKKKEE